jgi:hypothetical protein
MSRVLSFSDVAHFFPKLEVHLGDIFFVMPTPDLALAAFSTGVTSIQLLIQIIRTTQQVRRLKAECEEVRTISSILQELLGANEEVLKDEKTATQLNGVLLEVLKFTAECSGSNLVNRAWEVMWKHKLPGLLKDMMTWVVLLNTGTSVSGSLPAADL